MKKQAEDWLSAAEDDLKLIDKIIAMNHLRIWSPSTVNRQ
jgi:hypothetical protein